MFGPNRDHYFETIDEALESVVRWHKDEMCHDYHKDVLEEAAYWNEYFKKYPEHKIELINPDYKGSKNERPF